MASGIYLILWIFWFVALLVLYHKIFTVYYFSLSHGLMKELVTSAFLGLIMTAITLYLWYVSAIIILVIGLSVMRKTHNKLALIVAVVLAIVIAIVGINVKKDSDESNQTARRTIEQEYIVETMVNEHREQML